MPGMLADSKNLLSKGPLASRGFLIHLAAFVAVNVVLAAINLLLTPNKLWFYWVILGWGLGIVAHGLAEYYSGGRRSRARSRVERARRA